MSVNKASCQSFRHRYLTGCAKNPHPVLNAAKQGFCENLFPALPVNRIQISDKLVDTSIQIEAIIQPQITT